jgi:arginine decarboxylase
MEKRTSPKTPTWTIKDSAELYGIEEWGHGYFDVSGKGEVVVNLKDGKKTKPVSLAQIVRGMRERGTQLPVLIRFGDLLRWRIDELNEGFISAIKEAKYQGAYRGVYPIKVNQQQEVIEEITRYGRKYHYGLEAGSKPELIAALAYMHDPEAYIVCNGYKDEEFIDLALHAQKMGLQVILVLEMPSELDLILERCKKMGVRPTLGVRFRLSAESAGHWSGSGGDSSMFGLNISQLMRVVDTLREKGMLDCLRMLHYHQGSQIPNIRAIRQAVTEATRVYVGLVSEGARMGILDLGGGLAVSYDGLKGATEGSSNYGTKEYCADVIEAIGEVTAEAGVPHPDIITESGRAIVAYYSVLVINVLDVNRFEPHRQVALEKDAPSLVRNLWELREESRKGPAKTNHERLQEIYNDAVYYRDKLRSEFSYGKVTLRQRSQGEELYWEVLTWIASKLKESGHDYSQMDRLPNVMTDFYYGNFSVFQSLPDLWAIDQIFPVMPIHKLNQKPTRTAVLSDITCDSDGKIAHFAHSGEICSSLPLHDIDFEKKDAEDYMLGIFLVGAYQETLGDLHNLLGDTNVVSVRIENGKLKYTRELEGDSVAEVLSYVEYDTKDMVNRFRQLAEGAVVSKRIGAVERREIMKAYEDGLRGYTYFES